MASASQYKLSQQLLGHQGDVRALATHTTPADSALVLSVSRDKSASVWTRLPGSRNFEPPEVLGGHGGYVNSAAWLSDAMGTLFAVTGGQDKLINAFEVKVGLDGRAKASSSPDYTLLGHQDNVSALDVGPGGSYIVSGSWDKTARIWKGWECVATLKGHLQAVWAVLAVDHDRVLTASADKLVRLWSISKPNEPIAVFGGHTDAVRGLTLLPGDSSFASCSNDGTINIWSLTSLSSGGTNAPKQTLSGHTAFVYSLALSPSGHLVSSGEDRSVRVWSKEGDLIQTITIPAISVWTVATFADGDILCGSSDSHIRIFTRDGARAAPIEEVEAYERTVASQSLNKTQVGDVRKDQLEGKEALSKPGNKEGQVKMIANGNLTEAYQWSSSAHKWEKVGEVVGGVGSGTKKLFDGKEYDYVFDVDIADDAPPLKLPYNLNENAYVAAQRFLEKNELPMTYLEQVVSFIDKNTEGVNIGAGNESQGYVDPYSGTGRYIPGGGGTSSGAATAPGVSAPPSYKILPQKGYLSFKQANLAALQSKLAELAPAGQSLDISPVVSALEASDTAVPVSSVQGSLTSWPPASRFPLLDLLRLASSRNTDLEPSDLISSILEASQWTLPWPEAGGAESKARETNSMLAARALANLFSSSNGQSYLKSDAGAIKALESLQATNFSQLNKNGRVAFATVLYNFSVLIVTSGSSQTWSSTVLAGLTRILTEEPQGDGEVVYRALVGLGNLLVSKSHGSLNVGDVQLAKDAAAEWSNRLGGQEERVKTVVADINNVV
ncbi:unnamed protein product [Sympodiomycopsis kandeliae]